MNDPIRELWAQCVVKHTKTPMNWQDVADEFAQLIIAETVQVVRAGLEFGNGMEDAICQYFGVEL